MAEAEGKLVFDYSLDLIDEADIYNAMREAAFRFGNERVLEPYGALTTEELAVLRCAAGKLCAIAKESHTWREDRDQQFNEGFDKGFDEGAKDREAALREKHPLAFQLIDEQRQLKYRESATRKLEELERERSAMQAKIEAAKRELDGLHKELGELGMKQIDMASDAC